MSNLELQLPQDFDERLQAYLKKLGLKKLDVLQKKEKNTTLNPNPKFRFSEGVLFRDFVNDVLVFKDENSQEYRVIKIAMNLPVNERIDALTEELSFRQLYDTARRLNDKIMNTFKINGFFETDFDNKLVKRVVE